MLEPARRRVGQDGDDARPGADQVSFAPPPADTPPIENEVSYPVGADGNGDVWLQYAVGEPPLVVLVSQGGRLVRGWPGGVAGSRLRDHIDQLVLASTP